MQMVTEMLVVRMNVSARLALKASDYSERCCHRWIGQPGGISAALVGVGTKHVTQSEIIEIKMAGFR
jgi:hypothetical protein